MRANLLTHLGKLQPAECAAGRGGQLEVLLGRHPGLHGLQLASGQVGGVVPDQVALELIWLEVEMHWHRVAHGEVPGTASRERENPLANPIPTDLRAVPLSRANGERRGEYLDSSG